MAETKNIKILYLNPNGINFEVPEQQELREVQNGNEASDSNLQNVITVTKTETTLSKGDIKTQKIVVTEDISGQEVHHNGMQYHNPLYSEVQTQVIDTQPLRNPTVPDEATANVPGQKEGKPDEKKKTKIPKFRQAVNKARADKNKNQLTHEAAAPMPVCKSSITQLEGNTPSTKTNQPTKTYIQSAIVDEFEKMFEDIVDRSTNEVVIDELAQIVDLKEIDNTFDSLVNNYDENIAKPILVETSNENVKKTIEDTTKQIDGSKTPAILVEKPRSKIPMPKRKSEQDIIVPSDISKSYNMNFSNDILKNNHPKTKDSIMNSKAHKEIKLQNKAIDNSDQLEVKEEFSFVKEVKNKVSEKETKKPDTRHNSINDGSKGNTKNLKKSYSVDGNITIKSLKRTDSTPLPSQDNKTQDSLNSKPILSQLNNENGPSENINMKGEIEAKIETVKVVIPDWTKPPVIKHKLTPMEDKEFISVTKNPDLSPEVNNSNNSIHLKVSPEEKLPMKNGNEISVPNVDIETQSPDKIEIEKAISETEKVKSDEIQLFQNDDKPIPNRKVSSIINALYSPQEKSTVKEIVPQKSILSKIAVFERNKIKPIEPKLPTSKVRVEVINKNNIKPNVHEEVLKPPIRVADSKLSHGQVLKPPITVADSKLNHEDESNAEASKSLHVYSRQITLQVEEQVILPENLKKDKVIFERSHIKGNEDENILKESRDFTDENIKPAVPANIGIHIKDINYENNSVLKLEAKKIKENDVFKDHNEVKEYFENKKEHMNRARNIRKRNSMHDYHFRDKNPIQSINQRKDNLNTRNEGGLRRSKSIVEIDLGNSVRGKVFKIVAKISNNSSDNFVKKERKEVISQKEMPKKRSVLEKIALFEVK